ncbi:hypothetical protein, conserved [Eimeria praecox]|uniref:Uncharacterized protein n=1 Tax=Eimeria praecox TaxID=51316 RepID=U6H4M8_9EIME|nr:hypothetical protein, conserved [Eimeria praecox]
MSWVEITGYDPSCTWRNHGLANRESSAEDFASVGLLLLRRHKQRYPPAVRGEGNIPVVYGKPYRPITAEALAQDVELCRKKQRLRLLSLGLPASAAQAAADAKAAAAACEILGSSWAEEIAAASPNLGPSSALIAAAKAGAPLELHMHLKSVFCATLKAALLCDIAALQEQQIKQPQEQLLQPEADMHWLLHVTESVFKDAFYEPSIRAAASACDFAQPARELLQALQRIRTQQKRNSSSLKESLLPLLLTEDGRGALEKYIAAVDKQVLGSLCSSWERSGVLQTQAAPQQRRHEGAPARVRQLSALNTGKDAGTPMALSSYADAAERCKSDTRRKSSPLFLRASDVKAARTAIAKHGFVVIKNALTPEQLQEASEGGLKMKEVDPNIYCTRPTYGRLHCLLRGSLIEQSLLDAQRLFMPLVHSYLSSGAPPEAGGFQEERRLFVSEVQTVNAGCLCLRCRRLFVSEVQTVNADALALSQPWHRDNSHRGLTVVLPLVSISHSNGPTELLPGSHVLIGEGGDSWLQWLRSLPAFLKVVVAGGSTVKAEIQPGDALVYDSRLLHRGQANETWHPRPTLILRYDYKETPPPGVYTSTGIVWFMLLLDVINFQELYYA